MIIENRKLKDIPFSSSHVQIWEMDHKEGWVLKNWCFLTVLLEKTPESPVDCKIEPVDPKGNQFWIFIGRTDAEAPIFWPPDTNSWFTGKDPDAGKDWRQEEKGGTEWDDWMASPAQWTRVWENSGRSWRTAKTGMLLFLGLQRVRHDLATEQ